jgi:Ca2+-binding RTX toxin-like protein
MVAYIRSDLDFILAQIKIAEAHAAGQPLYGPGGLIPTYNLAWGLRTVDGSNNNLLHPTWGSSDQQFPEGLGTEFRTVMVPAGPGGALVPVSYLPGTDNGAGPSEVIDPEIRTISNLIVDQTLRNPSAILTALQRAGTVTPETQMAVTAEISAEYLPLRPLFDALGEAERVFANASAAAAASPGNAALQAAAAAAQADVTEAQGALDAADDTLMSLLDTYGVVLEGSNVSIPNVAPDEGLSAPFNSWFTLFGQFFDHGLDLVNKGASGTVFIPLMPDDPLYVPGGPTNFMVLTRATISPGVDGVLGTSDDVRPVNTTTPFVDQNQTYTSHPSHQVFLRQYVLNAAGDPVSTGKLIEGGNGGMATWAEVKAQAAELLGIQLLDSNVGNIPLLATDPYGNFIPGSNGFPQMVTATGLVEGDPTANGGLGVLVPANAVLTGHAFLADIAHTAVPTGIQDGDITIGLGNPENGPAEDGSYDNELLDAHYVAGDGRVNENIGLTAVHHVFHSEHNRLVEHTKTVTLADAAAMLANGATQAQAVAFLNEWLIDDVTTVPVTPAAIAALVWDGERIFQAAKFGTEMQYQHLVFEEFARKIQPNINVFLVPDGYDVTINPDIVAEFAHVVYRFGHSMLTETIDRFDPTFTDHDIGLIEGFLNPVQFANNGTGSPELDGISAGAIIRGMTRQEGNQIDEFVTSALRNNLLGLPLDLATINLARGRDTGVPSLNETRAAFYEATAQNSLLKPYESWVDFAGHLKNEASIINFIAAYGTHELITGQTTIEGKRDAALTIITGTSVGGLAVPIDAVEFLNSTIGSTWASNVVTGATSTGLDNVDLWIGGLAEEIMPFGGMLGSTFNFVFETQMEKLQNGDRFYYLQRLDGLHLFSEMEGNSFAALIMRNTNATHLPSDVFSTPGLILEVDRMKQYNPDLGPAGADDILLDDPDTAVNEAADNRTGVDGIAGTADDHLGNDPLGGGILTPLVVRNNPATPGADANYLKYSGDEHVLLGGTEAGDIIIASIGDDTLFGDGGNDRLEGGFGNDIINGGDGDDIIRDSGGDDNIKGGAGHDVVHAGPGLDLVLGGDGQDFVVLGTDMGSEVFGGLGNDFIFGNKNAERLLGNEGDDWLETGTFDGAPGDNFDEIFARDGIRGNDVFLGDGGFDEFIGEGGDDIFVGSPGRGKMAGMSGFDWATYKDNAAFVNADISVGIVFDEAPTLPANTALDEFESVQGLSGTRFNDILKGSEEDATTMLPLAQGGSTGYLGSTLDAQGIALIAGLQDVVGQGVNSFAAGDIILGGDGNDLIQGNAGDDIIDGDKWLNVRISVRAGHNANGPTGAEIATASGMTGNVTLRLDANGVIVPTGGTLVTKPLTTWMLEGKFNPGQLQIVREILTDTTAGDTDTAAYRGPLSNYAFGTTADGRLTVTDVSADPIDGSDILTNIERVRFGDGVTTPFQELTVVVGTPGNDPALNGTAGNDLIIGLAGNDTLNGLGGNDILVGGPNGAPTNIATENFSNNYTGGTGFSGSWTETNDAGTPAQSTGDIRVTGGRLAFIEGTDGGEIITRSVNLAAAGAVTLSFAYEGDDLDDGEHVVVEAWNGTTWDALGAPIGGDGNGTFFATLNSANLRADGAIRFRAEGTFEGGENLFIDNIVLSTGLDILNGGLGDDTYVFNPGDGSDIINEGVSATSGGLADRVSIVSTTIDPLTLLPVLSGLNAQDDNGGTTNGNLVINANGGTITVAGHFAGGTAGTGIERINFNNATYEGYLLGPDDYIVSRADPANRNAGGVNLSASIVNNFIVGEQGTSDQIFGGSGNDIIIGATGDNELNGGLGDDLLIGGSGTGDDDILDGGADLDTMIGLGGNDTYIVDDLGDVVIEAAAAGTDEVQTLMAALSIEAMANIENLTYTGADADPFVGTGNGLNNIITGGDLDDTLSGLGGDDILEGGLGADALVGGIGNDQLEGGAGADAMTGGDGNDVYEVDDAGDTVTETNADLVTGGTDRVESDIDYTLGENVENLDLNGTAIRGTGNALNNIINGNDEDNQIFGGAGNDTLNGDDGNDVIDGGLGNDNITGGNGNDTIIGNSGDDTIDVGGGVNTIVYNTPNFGADVINSFDAAGGTPATQDRIDLSALGITADNFAARVTEGTIGGTGNTLLTITDGAANQIGTIRVNNVTNANMDITDFTLATPSAVLPGATTGNNTLNGTAGNDIINALAGNDTVNGGGGNDTITGGPNGTGGPGADVLNGDAGDDTFVWSAGTSTATSLTNSDGRDQINGGTEGAVGDTYVINGNGASETYNIYTLAAWDAVGTNNLNSFNGRTPEIVITRGGTGFANVIAELSEIEEIRVNGVDPSGTTGGAGAGDTFNIIGDFSGTNLRLNTITIDGDEGDDTIDISALTSAHRIVFKSNGGNDTIIGALQAEDVIELPEGADLSTYELVENPDGTKTISNGTHSVTFTGVVPPQFQTDEPGDDEEDDDEAPDDNDDETPATPVAGTLRTGTSGSDTLVGTTGDDNIVAFGGDDVAIGDAGADAISLGDGADFASGGDGRDVIFGGAGDDQLMAGAGADIVYGDAGADRIFGDDGNDLITAGAGDDTVFGGAGDDLFVAENGDGNDVYFGHDNGGGPGSDTLDMSAVSANVTVNLGSGPLLNGTASSSQTGNDTIWGIENVNTGSGNDTITASNAVNVMNGGAGDDTFKFTSTTAANGDTIVTFEPGDRIDLTGIDANIGTAGDQSFTLVTGAPTEAGQLGVTFETRAEGDVTVVQGNIDGNADAEFTIEIAGHQNLTNANLGL